jgi:hypothetical protein
VIDVSDRPDIYVRLAAVKFLFCHIPTACSFFLIIGGNKN